MSGLSGTHRANGKRPWERPPVSGPWNAGFRNLHLPRACPSHGLPQHSKWQLGPSSSPAASTPTPNILQLFTELLQAPLQWPCFHCCSRTVNPPPQPGGAAIKSSIQTPSVLPHQTIIRMYHVSSRFSQGFPRDLKVQLPRRPRHLPNASFSEPWPRSVLSSLLVSQWGRVIRVQLDKWGKLRHGQGKWFTFLQRAHYRGGDYRWLQCGPVPEIWAGSWLGRFQGEKSLTSVCLGVSICKMGNEHNWPSTFYEHEETQASPWGKAWLWDLD